ncbi:hypothetical protein D9M71_619440 [compost metagenome]
MHFLINGLHQVLLAGFGGKLQTLLQQAKGHMHAGHRCAQFVGSTQDEFVAHALEIALLGDVANHHHRTDVASIVMGHGGHAPGQQAGFAVDFHRQVFRCALLGSAA